MGAPAQTKTEYFGSAAQVFCFGRGDTLHNLSNGDTVIWEGPITRAGSMDGDGKTVLTTTIGEMHWYWGTLTQNPSAILEAIVIDQGDGPFAAPIPAWRGYCILVMVDCSFGSQTTPPTINAELTCLPETDLVLTAHELDGDCVLAEFIYEILTNRFWGAGRAAAEINSESFIAACETLIDEDNGASPDFDDLQKAREMIGKLLPYMDAVIFFQHGQFHLKLIRQEDPGTAIVLNESDFTDEPLPRNDLYEGVDNFFRLTFHDRENNWEDGVEPYSNPATNENMDQDSDSQLDFPYITRRSVAKQVVKRIGLKQSKPSFFFEVRLQPTHNGLNPGDLVKVNYSRLTCTALPDGFVNALCRVMEVERSRPEEPEVAATLMLEHTRDTTFDYVPPDDFFFTPPSIDDSGSADWAIVSVSPRVQALPPGLKGDSADGCLVAFDRTDTLLRRAKVHWTWDPVQKDYQQLGVTKNFPHYAELIGWHKLSATNWFLRLRFPDAAARNAFAGDAPTAPEWIFDTGHREVTTVGTPADEHQIAGIWGSRVESGYFLPVDTLIHDIEVTSGLYGSAAMALETFLTAANAPTRHIYFGARDDFFVFPTNDIAFERNLPNAPVNVQTGLSADTDMERLFKVTVGNHKNEETLTDVSEVEFDRNDTTMHPDGTYTPDWGERALTTYEYFDEVAGNFFIDPAAPFYPDVDDIDEALGAIYEGTATDTQLKLWAPVDDVLGIYLDFGIYSDAP